MSDQKNNSNSSGIILQPLNPHHGETKETKEIKDTKEDNYLPSNHFVDAMLTDLYQITMAYGYWKAGRHEEEAVFDLFFRQNPFKGEFTIFAGLEEVLRYVQTFHFKDRDIAILKARYSDWDSEFWVWLSKLTTDKVRIYAIAEGTVVFPRVPLIRVEGPLAIAQLLETTLLVLVNYASLIATNAARHRLAVGPKKSLLEFGLRRAQGPDGAMSASRYAYIGGFDGTSNVKAGCMFGIGISGTHAHSFVTSFVNIPHPNKITLKYLRGTKTEDFVTLTLRHRTNLRREGTNKGELGAFISYAQAFPDNFLALIDTYDTLQSGIWNFVCVSLALHDFGYKAKGIRLDSGDLAYLSKECRAVFECIFKTYGKEYEYFKNLTIVASNDISETVLWSLKEQGHEIDSFGIGTNLVTCKTQPALGCVYKLVEVQGEPRIKISQDVSKVTIPGKKEAYRLYSAKGEPVLDLLITVGSAPPSPQRRVLCRHPFDVNKRAYVTPSKVVPLHECVFDGKITKPFPSLNEIKQRVSEHIATMREDHLRRVNPTPYKISVSADLFTFMHELWNRELPVSEIS